LVVHGDQNTIVPIEQSLKLVNFLPEGKLLEIKGAEHKYTNNEHFDTMIDSVFHFVKEKLSSTNI